MTKEQFYTFFARYIEVADTALVEAAEVPLVPGDESVSSWAYPAVYHLRACGFQSAEQAVRFAPKSGMTRAEAAEMIAWFMKAGAAA